LRAAWSKPALLAHAHRVGADLVRTVAFSAACRGLVAVGTRESWITDANRLGPCDVTVLVQSAGRRTIQIVALDEVAVARELVSFGDDVVDAVVELVGAVDEVRVSFQTALLGRRLVGKWDDGNRSSGSVGA